MFDKVHIIQYITQGTFDSYLFQTIEHKQKYISQIMSNKSPARSCSDLDETVLNYSEIKALAAGDTRVREKMELDNEVKRLTLEKQSFYSAQKRMQNFVDNAPRRLSKIENKIEQINKDIARYKPPAEFEIEIWNVKYDKRTDAGSALTQQMKITREENTKIGSYANFDLYTKHPQDESLSF